MAHTRTYLIADGEPEFPFDKLVLDTRDITKNHYGGVHQGITIETSPGLREDFRLKFPCMKSHSITYHNNSSIQNPSLYIAFDLHPEWNAENHKTSPTGLAVERFWEKFVAAIDRLCLQMFLGDRINLMGSCSMAMTPDARTTFVESVAKHPEYPRTHLHAGRQDPDRTKFMMTTIWTGVTKDNNDEENKRHALVIPDTNTSIYTKIYDLTTENRIRVGFEKAAEPISDYSLIKKAIFNAHNHPNANNVKADLIVEPTLLSPVITWNDDGNPGKIGNKVSDLRITHFNERVPHVHTLSPTEIRQTQEAAKQKMVEFGLQEAPLTTETVIKVGSRPPIKVSHSVRDAVHIDVTDDHCITIHVDTHPL